MPIFIKKQAFPFVAKHIYHLFSLFITMYGAIMIANPNCTTIMMVVALNAVQIAEWPIKNKK
ncbi:MAG: hypothetical protein MJZ18_01160 [Bacteroidales bacterium]|nr:hypothetical protein [Bacteroidales bacterium]